MEPSAYDSSEDYRRKEYVCLNPDCSSKVEVGKTRLPRVDYELDEVPLQDKPMRMCDGCGGEMVLLDEGHAAP